MKILQVNNHYAYGSTGKIVECIHLGLEKRGVESVVCHGRGNSYSPKNIRKICGELYSKANNLLSRITGLMYGGLFFSTSKLISEIKKEKPDVVHLQCLNGYFVNIYRLISWLNRNRIPTVLTLHAEFMHTANCGHAYDCEKWKTGCGKCPRLRAETKSWFFDGTARSWKKMKRAFEGFENLQIVSVSPWLRDRACQSPILKDKNHRVVFNGVNTEVFHCQDAQDLREKHGLTDENVLFFATPFFTNDINHVKGGHYIIELAKSLKNENVKIFVAGRYENNLNLPDNMVMLGQINEQALLAKYYALADVSLLASKRETFSMICAESLCVGTPIVGFKAGAPEQISIKEYSKFVEYGDVEGLKSAVLEMLKNLPNKEEVEKKAATQYSLEKMVEDYLKIYYEM